MALYNVSGMSCAACVARVERAVNAVPGVASCAVNLLTHTMRVEGQAESADIMNAVARAGYAATPGNGAANPANPANPGQTIASLPADNDASRLSRRLLVSLAFLAMLLPVSMGTMFFNFPLPAFFVGNPMAIGLLQFVLALIIAGINRQFFVGGFKAVLNLSPNMDSLVAIGSGSALVYGVVTLFAMSRALVDGNIAHANHLMHELYFESAATILTLITAGKMLEARARGKTTSSLRELLSLAPSSATVVRDGVEKLVPLEDIRQGDLVIVRPGENIPVDGLVTEGYSTVNEAAITGESLPVNKKIGDHVSAGTTNLNGHITCVAKRVGDETSLARIVSLVTDAVATKAPIARIADKVSAVFVPSVIAIALITVAGWLLCGENAGFALARGISVLVISCPCALGLATPVAIMVGSGIGARNGILFKSAAALEQTGRISAVAFDKTGTITIGEPHVTDIVPCNNHDEMQLLALAAALEKMSEHPFAKAILRRAEEQGITAGKVSDFMVEPGYGLGATLGGSRIVGGNLQFVEKAVRISPDMVDTASALAKEGKTPLYFARDGVLAGIIAVADVLRPESADTVRQLRGMGINVVLLTGDNECTARAVGRQAGIDDIVAEVRPDGKESIIRNLQEKSGSVAMVGDGINDAPALARADIGIAIGAGTDVAIEAADIVLMKSNPADVPAAIRLGRATMKNIRQNLFWAFVYNILGIPLAAGLFGWQLNPVFAAAAMSLSSFCVVSNALRLNLCKIHDGPKSGNQAPAASGHKDSVVVIRIEGMMCPHCEATVKAVLEGIPGVARAEVSHRDGKAIVTASEPPDSDMLRESIEAKDYRVTGIHLQ